MLSAMVEALFAPVCWISQCRGMQGCILSAAFERNEPPPFVRAYQSGVPVEWNWQWFHGWDLACFDRSAALWAFLASSTGTTWADTTRQLKGHEKEATLVAGREVQGIQFHVLLTSRYKNGTQKVKRSGNGSSSRAAKARRIS
jgi:hypothetical protein